MTSRELNRRGLSGFEIAVVGYVGSMSDEAAAAMVDFVNGGGDLFVFCGEGRVDEHLQQMEIQAGEPFVPFVPNRLEVTDDFTRAPFIDSGKWNSRWLEEFDVQGQIALRQIRFPRVWIASHTRADAEVLLSYSHRQPAIALRHHGRGRIVLANFSPSISFSEFGTYDSFVVLIQVLLGKMVAERDVVENLVGSSIVFDPPQTSDGNEADLSELTVIAPDGSIVPRLQTTIHGAKTLMVDVARVPGFYRLQDDRETIQQIHINVDPRESDLRQISAEQIQTGDDRPIAVTSGDGLDVNVVDRGTPLWGWLAILVLAVLGIESFLTGWWRR